jgi:GDP-mannose transporter
MVKFEQPYLKFTRVCSILSIPVLFVFSLLVEFKGFFKFYDDHLAPGTQNSGYLWGLSMGILVSSVSAFAISYATSWSMRVTSSTTYRYLIRYYPITLE